MRPGDHLSDLSVIINVQHLSLPKIQKMKKIATVREANPMPLFQHSVIGVCVCVCVKYTWNEIHIAHTCNIFAYTNVTCMYTVDCLTWVALGKYPQCERGAQLRLQEKSNNKAMHIVVLFWWNCPAKASGNAKQRCGHAPACFLYA